MDAIDTGEFVVNTTGIQSIRRLDSREAIASWHSNQIRPLHAHCTGEAPALIGGRSQTITAGARVLSYSQSSYQEVSGIGNETTSRPQSTVLARPQS